MLYSRPWPELSIAEVIAHVAWLTLVGLSKSPNIGRFGSLGRSNLGNAQSTNRLEALRRLLSSLSPWGIHVIKSIANLCKFAFRLDAWR